MTLTFVRPRDVTLHYQYSPGAVDVRPVVFFNSLGTDLRIWQGVSDLLPAVPMLMLDQRGHGLSDMGAISIGGLAEDAADLMDHLGLSAGLLCGVSVGGMIAQTLAVRRPDLVAGLVLCNTGTRIGDAEAWNARIEAVRKSGIEPMADQILERWFSPDFRASQPTRLAGYRNMLTRTTPDGYAGTCAAIRDTDLADAARHINVPAICLGGSEDSATPADLVADLAGKIAGSKLQIIDGVGHLPCIERPDVVSGHIQAMLQVLS